MKKTTQPGLPHVPNDRMLIGVGEGRTAVELRLLDQGRDLLVVVSGGAAHVGAVAVWDGSRNSGAHSREESTFELPGHREGPLAAETARAVAEAAECRCVAVAGIHQDNATGEEIDQIVHNVREGLRRLVAGLNGPVEPEAHG